MRLYRSLEEMNPLTGGSRAVAIGVFDGVHRGHRKIISRAVTVARAVGGVPCVLTFEPHPQTVVAPGSRPASLTSLRQKLELVEALGVEETAVIPFDERVASMSPDDFCRNLLVERLGASAAVVGENFRFGAQAAGTVEALRVCGGRYGFDVEAVGLLADRAGVVSSTRIRGLLVDGAVDRAAALLGRPYRLDGYVVAGAGWGRDLGIPTANLQVGEGLVVPGAGVYVTEALSEGRSLPSVTSVGSNPTFLSGGPVQVETHILDFSGGLYGTWLEVNFLRRLRGQRRFASADDLVAQIEKDISDAQEYFDNAAVDTAP